ncbi:MAG: hypothetical protein D6734_02730 [Candidatus Schekmanbacteria bacterium]|nr:MAG: hypothetical protein D6734_02730 [Candidatus Schekmanbacteria bacterium]
MSKIKESFVFDIANLIREEKRYLLLASPIFAERIKNNNFKSLTIDYLQWENSVETIFKYGLSGIIFTNLKKAGLLDLLPEKEKLKLQHLYHSNAARNALISQILDTLSQLFKENGKTFLLLQGTALISDIYPQPAMRYLSDIDIMIKPDDIKDVDNILRENGFTATNFPGDLKWCFENLNHMPHYYYPGFNSPIEIHFKTADTFFDDAPNSNWIWEDCKESKDGKNYKIPSAENLLLSISAHIAKKSHIADLRFIPRHCCDINAVIDKYADSLNSKILFERASKNNLLDSLAYSLAMTKIFFPTEKVIKLADESEKLSSDTCINLAETVVKFLLCEKSDEILLDGWMTFFKKPGIWKKLLFLATHIFPSPKRMKDIYGSDAKGIKLISYYFSRPLHLINRFSFSRIKFSSRLAKTKK